MAEKDAPIVRFWLVDLREAEAVLVKVGALDQARAVRRALEVLEAIDGATVTFEANRG